MVYAGCCSRKQEEKHMAATKALIITDPGSPDNSLPGGGGIDNTLPPVQGPVDPGYGYPLPPVIDNGLPDIPGIWPPRPPTYPVYPNNDLPTRPGLWPNPPAPPGVWPPTPPLRPSHPIYPARPTDPGYGHPEGGHRPDQGLPGEGTPPDRPEQGLPPHVGGRPPGSTPPRPDQGLPPAHGRPDQGLPPSGGHPDQGLPLPPGSVWPPLPPSVQGPIIAFCWIVGVGYRWVVIDPSLHPDNELPGERPPHASGQPIPERPPGHISGQPLPPGHVSGQPVPPPPEPPPATPTHQPAGKR
jgi:hypothetical protein